MVLPGQSEARLLVGSLAGVPRSSGGMTMGRVLEPDGATPTGFVRVQLDEAGSFKVVDPAILRCLPATVTQPR